MKIRYMSRGVGAKPAANNNAGTAQPSEGSVPSLSPGYTGEVMCMTSNITLAAATDDVATGDIYVAMPLPSNCKPVDAIIASGDIDSGASLTMTLAKLAKDFTDIVAGSDLITASTVGQAGGVARAAVAAGLQGSGSDDTAWYGIKVAAGVTGLNAGAVLQVTIFYKAITN